MDPDVDVRRASVAPDEHRTLPSPVVPSAVVTQIVFLVEGQLAALQTALAFQTVEHLVLVRFAVGFERRVQRLIDGLFLLAHNSYFRPQSSIVYHRISFNIPSDSPPWKFSGSGTCMRSNIVLQRFPRRTSSLKMCPWCLIPRREPPANIVGR